MLQSMSHCYEHDVRPSVCVSVTLVDYDHIVQQKYWRAAHDRIGLGYLHAETDPDCNIR